MASKCSTYHHVRWRLCRQLLMRKSEAWRISKYLPYSLRSKSGVLLTHKICHLISCGDSHSLEANGSGLESESNSFRRLARKTKGSVVGLDKVIKNDLSSRWRWSEPKTNPDLPINFATKIKKPQSVLLTIKETIKVSL